MPTKFKAGFQDFDPAAIASNLPEPLQWTGGALLGGLKSALGLMGGETPEQSAGASLGGPLMAAEGELTPIAKKAGDALSGLYSRVSRVASKLPESIHPNKLSSVLKNQANPEEVEFRNLGKFLKGNEQVKKADLLSHLEANPEPEINLTTLSDAKRPSGPIESMPHSEFMDWQESAKPKYGSYQLPGGENYKENLITTPGKEKMVPTGSTISDVMMPKSSVEDLNAVQNYGTNVYDPETGKEFEHGIYEMTGVHHDTPEYAQEYADKYNGLIMGSRPEMELDTTGNYESPHWDEPNVLVHSRTQDRPLNPTTQWGPEHFTHEVPDPDNPMFALRGREYAFRRADGQLISGFGNSPEEALRDVVEAHGKPWMGGDTPPQLGPKIRNIENIQSDWHQAGAKSGYGPTELSSDELNQLHHQDELLGNEHYDTLQDLGRKLGLDLPANHREVVEALNINKQFDPDLQEAHRSLQDLIERRHDIQERLQRYESGTNIPDAPFKDKGWLDLALKHQLLDVANSPDIQGISITPGSEMVRRGEGQSPVFNDQQIPNALKRLLKPFGGGEPSMIPMGANKEYGIDPVMNRGINRGPKGFNARPSEDDWEHIASLWPPPVEPTSPPFTEYNSREVQPRYEELLNQVQKTNPIPQQTMPYFQITPAMKEALKKQGLPLLSIMGLAAAQPNQGEQ